MNEKNGKEIIDKKAELVEIPTQTSIAYKLENEEVVSEQELFIRIYNVLKRIEKAVA